MMLYRLIGVALAAMGVVLFIMGLNATDAFTEQVGEAVTGNYSDATTWRIVGGIGLAVLGVLLMLLPRGQKQVV